jgi:hypothetical protein
MNIETLAATGAVAVTSGVLVILRKEITKATKLACRIFHPSKLDLIGNNFGLPSDSRSGGPGVAEGEDNQRRTFTLVKMSLR